MVNEEVINSVSKFLVPILTWGSIILLFFVLYKFSIKLISKTLMYRAKSKKERDNIRVFIHLTRYVFVTIIGFFLLFIFTGSFTGLGIIAGLLTAGLGFALQKPITGIAAWLMIIMKKPFQIDDRIIIGNIKGDVEDITVSHIHLREIGGTTEGDDLSGRLIIVPNSVLFEKEIINYTLQNDFILDEVKTLITYESNLKKAKEICLNAAKDHLQHHTKKAPTKPRILIVQKDSGIELKVRYSVLAFHRTKTSSAIAEAIINNIGKSKTVNIAYPHMRILYTK